MTTDGIASITSGNVITQRRLVQVVPRVLVESLLPVKDEEEHPERIESRDEYADQQAGDRRTWQPGMRRQPDRLDQRILGEEAGEPGEADQRQGARPGSSST